MERLAHHDVRGPSGLPGLRVAGDSQDPETSGPWVRSQVGDQLSTIHDRHHHVGHDKIRQRVLDSDQGGQPVLSFDDLVAGTFEDQPEQESDARVVIHDQNCLHAAPIALGRQDSFFGRRFDNRNRIR